MAMDNQPVPVPLAILAHKIVPSDTGPKHLVLVQWQGLHPDEASREAWSTLKSRHHLEDKVLFKYGGNDTSSKNSPHFNLRYNMSFIIIFELPQDSELSHDKQSA